MRIAIYSGVMPSTVFIENMIDQAASLNHNVYLFGKRPGKPINYKTGKVQQFPTPQSWLNVVFFVFYYQLKLILLYPKRFFLLHNHISKVEKRWPKRFRLWAKYLPPVFYLPDIFHIQWAKSLEEWFFLKQLYGVHLALSLRGTHVNISPKLDPILAETYRRLFPSISAFHAVSKEIALEALKYGANSEKIHVIYSPQTAYNLPLEAVQQQPFTFLLVGRIHWVKGHRLVLEALHLLKLKGLSCTCNIVGEGPTEELQYLAYHHGVADDVQFLGKKSHTEVIALMRQSSALVLSSYEEGIANVVLEAMSVGLPVVSSNCGGMSEVIQPGVSGWLFQKGETFDLADKMERCMHMNPEESLNMRKAAHAFIQQNMNPNLYSAQLASFYNQIMADREI
jgi:colanic acid/amylovoran biosynthesis glycosyltransferase